MEKKRGLWIVILWTITAISSVFGGLILFSSYNTPTADIAAALAARGIAFAVIPYVFTRSIAEIKKS